MGGGGVMRACYVCVCVGVVMRACYMCVQMYVNKEQQAEGIRSRIKSWGENFTTQNGV